MILAACLVWGFAIGLFFRAFALLASCVALVVLVAAWECGIQECTANLTWLLLVQLVALQLGYFAGVLTTAFRKRSDE